MKWFSKVGNQEVFLSIDIRSSGIGILLHKNFKGGAKVIFAERYKASAQNNQMLNKERLAMFLDQVLTDFFSNKLSRISEDKKIKIKKIKVYFSAPWYKANLKHILFSEKKPVKFTKELYMSLLKKEPLLSNKNQEGLSTVERNITHVLLNNYELSNPFNKEVSNIDIAFYVGRVDTSTINTVKSVISKHVKSAEESFHTHGFTTFNVLRNIYPNLTSFSFIDVSAEVTEIGVVKNNVLKTLITIPYGKKNIVNSVAEQCGMDFENALSTLNIISRDEHHETCKVSMTDIVSKEGQRWAEEIKKAMPSENNTSLPSKVFLLSDPEIQKIIAMFLKTESMKNSNLISNKNDIIQLTRDKLSEKITSEARGFIDSIFITQALSTSFDDN